MILCGAAFIFLVILRYHRQQAEANIEERVEGGEKEQPQLTMVVAGGGGGGSQK